MLSLLSDVNYDYLCVTNWKGRGRKRSWPDLRYYPDIWLKGLRKSGEISVRLAALQVEMNLGPPEY
jgi:hypothetical protein